MEEMSQNPQEAKKVDIRKLKSRKTSTSTFITVGMIVLALVSWFLISRTNYKGQEVKFNEAIARIESGNYDQIEKHQGYITVDYTDKTDVNGQSVEAKKRVYANVEESNETFTTTLKNAGVTASNPKLTYVTDVTIEIWDIVLLASFGVGLYMVYMLLKNMQNSGGKIFEFGQSKARLMFGKKTGITFKDVAGIDDAKEDLVEIVDFLKSPKKYIDAGARIPKGVLLVGAPGTGKTLLARAVAGEAGVPFFHTSGSEFEEMLVGAGASRVRDLFKKAKRTAPCIIFIDEVDAIAKKRGTVLQAGNTEQTLNQLLVEMDGLEPRENVIVLAATNRPDVLDPAILRPGRFDRTVTVLMPDLDGRKSILAVHSGNKKFEEGVNIDVVAKKTVGYSGADLENLLNEAAIMAAKDGRKMISQEDLMESYLKVKLGRKKKNKVTEDDIKRFAYHEAGHAVVGKFTKGSDPVEQISIISRGSSGGVTLFLPDEETRVDTKSKLLGYIQHAVGGKVAEEVFLGEMSTGASSDIKHTTEIAKAFVKQYGMSDKLGFVQYENLDEMSYLGYQYGGEKDYSDTTAKMIDEEIKSIVDTAQNNARDILTKNKDKVEALVKVLLEKEVVLKEEFDALFV